MPAKRPWSAGAHLRLRYGASQRKGRRGEKETSSRPPLRLRSLHHCPLLLLTTLAAPAVLGSVANSPTASATLPGRDRPGPVPRRAALSRKYATPPERPLCAAPRKTSSCSPRARSCLRSSRRETSAAFSASRATHWRLPPAALDRHSRRAALSPSSRAVLAP